MQKFEYEDRDGDHLYINRDCEDGLEISVQLQHDGEYFIFVEDEDAPRIARALLERAGHKVGGKTFADAAVGALKDHEEEGASRQKDEDVKVHKYFKEVRKIDLDRVQDKHREEFKRLQDFNKEVFSRPPRIVSWEDRMKADPNAKWKTKQVGPIYFVFEYDHRVGRWDANTSAPNSKKEPYDGTLYYLSHSYFPLEEVLD